MFFFWLILFSTDNLVGFEAIRGFLGINAA
jgi:hypothetical protein